MLIKSEEKNRGEWKIGIVEKFIVGKDGIIRGAKLRAGKNYIDRTIRQLYPMELSCDRKKEQPENNLSANAAEFKPRREAAVTANQRIRAIASDERNNSD